jgi:hypothetical protein
MIKKKVDGNKLLLLFPINSHGFIRLGDGKVIEDWRK